MINPMTLVVFLVGAMVGGLAVVVGFLLGTDAW